MKGFRMNAAGTGALISSYEELADFDEEVCISIITFSNDKLTRMMAFEIGRLKGFKFAREPEPEDKIIA